MKFYRLSIGADFRFLGKQYKKVGHSCAQAENRDGHLFLGVTDVEPLGEPRLLSEEEAAKWKPDYGIWNDVVKSFYGDTSV